LEKWHRPLGDVALNHWRAANATLVAAIDLPALTTALQAEPAMAIGVNRRYHRLWAALAPAGAGNLAVANFSLLNLKSSKIAQIMKIFRTSGAAVCQR
jgi:hypothetical protein